MTTQSENQTGTLSTPLVSYSSGQYLPPIDPILVEKALTVGDVAKMDAATRVQFYRALCLTTGVNPLTRPFILLKTRPTEHNPGGELVWYATVGACEQLRKLHHVSTKILSRERTPEDLYVVTVQASTPDGREEESQGIEYLGGLKGQPLGNAMMKAQSKALRRVTLALCGLGMGLAEEESGQIVPFDAQTGDVQLPPPAEAETLLHDVGQWFRAMHKDLRAGIAQAVWGCTLKEMPHLGYEELDRGWHLIDGGRARLAWDSPTLADEVQQWRQRHAAQAVAEVFGEEGQG